MNVLDQLSKPTIAGITAGAITRYVTYGNNEFGNPYKLEVQSAIPGIKMLNGKQVNLVLLTGVAVGLASLVADVVTDNVFDFITEDEVMENIGSGVFQVGAVSAGTVIAHGAVNSYAIGQRGLLNIIGLASATELIASYVHSKLVKPLIYEPTEEPQYVF